jgi:hypothetical protein
MDQINLFPLSALQTKGYAQPEPAAEVEVEVADDDESTEDAA